MEKRALGKTGLSLSALGFGGFHLVEIPSSDASLLLNSYLDRGGNYIETAAEYGDGISEEKIGRAVAHRRGQFVLATKTLARTRDASAAEIDRSLRLLHTDHVDVLFLHCVQTPEEIRTIFGPGGALEAVTAARKAGKVRFIGITGHGRPDGLLAALPLFPFDVMMTGFNYYDRFNFPTVEGELLPRCRDAGMGIIAMKALADGYLYRSAVPAIRYALGLPVATVVMGINTREMLDADIEAVQSFRPLDETEREELFRSAPELGSYVCRLCGKCSSRRLRPAIRLPPRGAAGQADGRHARSRSRRLGHARAAQGLVRAGSERPQGIRGARPEGGPRGRLRQPRPAVPVRHRRGPQAEDRALQALRGAVPLLGGVHAR